MPQMKRQSHASANAITGNQESGQFAIGAETGEIQIFMTVRRVRSQQHCKTGKNRKKRTPGFPEMGDRDDLPMVEYLRYVRPHSPGSSCHTPGQGKEKP